MNTGDMRPLLEALEAFPGVHHARPGEMEDWRGSWFVTMSIDETPGGRHAREFLAYLATHYDAMELEYKAAMPVPGEPGAQAYWLVRSETGVSPEAVARLIRATYRELYGDTPQGVREALEGES